MPRRGHSPHRSHSPHQSHSHHRGQTPQGGHNLHCTNSPHHGHTSLEDHSPYRGHSHSSHQSHSPQRGHSPYRHHSPHHDHNRQHGHLHSPHRGHSHSSHQSHSPHRGHNPHRDHTPHHGHTPNRGHGQLQDRCASSACCNPSDQVGSSSGHKPVVHITRDSFPDNFMFGTASSAYQYEGAIYEDHRGESVWDHFTHKFPKKTHNEDGRKAVDFYHRFKKDIKRMKEINMDSFRLSISWARVLPQGTVEKGVNQEGIDFYNDVIDELIANGIKPNVTLFHWDIPQCLEFEYRGFLSKKVIVDFRDYARLCFDEFGDRVKYWVTINEPYIYSIAGYETGKKAPGRCLRPGHEAYIVSRNLLLAHAEAVEEFRNHPKCKNGKIGMAHSPPWFEPYDAQSCEDKKACKRALEFAFGWHMHPTTYGDYPQVMKEAIPHKSLRSFTPEESEKLKNSYDFVGINYYSSVYTTRLIKSKSKEHTCKMYEGVEWKKRNVHGKLIGPQGALEWMLSYPNGIRKLTNYIKDTYNNPIIMITENGYGDKIDDTKPLSQICNDFKRVKYHEQHLESLYKAITEDGVRVKGYYAWSLLDNFEWQEGYGVRFGLFYVDFKDNLKRHPKASALWFKEFLKSKKKKEHHDRHHR